MQNLSLEELHRDIQDIKSDIKDIQGWAISEMKSLEAIATNVDKRLTRLEARASVFALFGGLLMGLIGEVISHLFQS